MRISMSSEKRWMTPKPLERMLIPFEIYDANGRQRADSLLMTLHQRSAGLAKAVYISRSASANSPS